MLDKEEKTFSDIVAFYDDVAQNPFETRRRKLKRLRAVLETTGLLGMGSLLATPFLMWKYGPEHILVWVVLGAGFLATVLAVILARPAVLRADTTRPWDPYMRRRRRRAKTVLSATSGRHRKMRSQSKLVNRLAARWDERQSGGDLL